MRKDEPFAVYGTKGLLFAAEPNSSKVSFDMKYQHNSNVATAVLMLLSIVVFATSCNSSLFTTNSSQGDDSINDPVQITGTKPKTPTNDPDAEKPVQENSRQINIEELLSKGRELPKPKPLLGLSFGVAIDIDDDFALVSDGEIQLRHRDRSMPLGLASVLVYHNSADTWKLEARLQPEHLLRDDDFGRSVAIDGSYIIVGAPFDSFGAYTSAGSAFVYKGSEGTWILQEELRASRPKNSANFGHSVALSGNSAIVSAYFGSNAGEVYIYRLSDESWQEEALLTPSDGALGDQFGYSVAISGNYAIVGSPLSSTVNTNNQSLKTGKAYIFEYSDGIWKEVAILFPESGLDYDFFGASVDILGNRVAVGAERYDEVDPADGSNSQQDIGRVYLYARNGDSWEREAVLRASDASAQSYFGAKVRLAEDIVIASSSIRRTTEGQNPALYIFQNQEGRWSETALLGQSDISNYDSFPKAFAINTDGQLFVSGTTNNIGEVRVFDLFRP